LITAQKYRGKTIGVFGLARTGLAAVRALSASGAIVRAWDDDQNKRTEVPANCEDLYAYDFSELDALLLAPGVPLTHPAPHEIVKKATITNTPLISDLDVFEAARDELADHKLIAVTGTNGKSTTSVLIGHVLSACRVPSVVGGNIGTGVLALDPLTPGGAYVFELSSFQLDLTQSIRADVAVLLNVSPDHLDRHGDFENYFKAKTKLFQMQKDDGTAIIGVDDASGRALAQELGPQTIRVSGYSNVSGGIFVENGVLFDGSSGETIEVGDISSVQALQGKHNWQNAAAAYAACRTLGLGRAEILAGLRSFAGLAHRQQTVGETGGVRFVNDSKATNSEAAARALASFSNIHWIAGGRAKEKSFAGLLPYLPTVKNSYFIGEAAHQLVEDLPASNSAVYSDLGTAFRAACEKAKPGETILLSPACTAFDQYSDFEARGEVFTRLVADFVASDKNGRLEQ